MYRKVGRGSLVSNTVTHGMQAAGECSGQEEKQRRKTRWDVETA